jgi:hypothetical protein
VSQQFMAAGWRSTVQAMVGEKGGLVVKPMIPLLVFLLPSALILLVGFAVLFAAERRPKTVSALIGVVVAAGLGIIAYAALVAGIDQTGPWLAVGLALVILGCPAWLLVYPRGAHSGKAAGHMGVADVAKLLFAYLCACWLFTLALAVFLHLTTSSPGSLR